MTQQSHRLSGIIVLFRYIVFNGIVFQKKEKRCLPVRTMSRRRADSRHVKVPLQDSARGFPPSANQLSHTQHSRYVDRNNIRSQRYS